MWRSVNDDTAKHSKIEFKSSVGRTVGLFLARRAKSGGREIAASLIRSRIKRGRGERTADRQGSYTSCKKKVDAATFISADHALAL